MSGSFVQNLSFFIKGTNKSLPSSESLFSALMPGQCPVFVLYCCCLGVVASSFFLLFYVTAAIFQLYKKINSTATYSFIGSLSSNGPTFSKYSNMLICSTCRFRQLATNMSCSVKQEISPSSMLMLTADIA